MEAPEAEELEAVLTKVEAYESAFQTGNATLDIILTEKKMLCQQEEISFSCMADGVALEFMNELDLASLFGNSLDNAIEQERKEAVEKRYIFLKVQRNGMFVSIRIENYCEIFPDFSRWITCSFLKKRCCISWIWNEKHAICCGEIWR